MTRLVLVRGLPGSGKSTLARQLLAQGYVSAHFEADMFFELSGKYKFVPNKLIEAHRWCQHNTRKALLNGESVAVSNTFTKYWELEFYINLATELGVDIELRECSGTYQNIHNVPVSAIERMRERWEHVSL